jgi:CheY-like chemotaxis protein
MLENGLKPYTGTDDVALGDAEDLDFASALPLGTAEIVVPAVYEWLGEETILLVEDETFVRQATAEALQSAGYRVTLARNASEALESHSQVEKVDLLLADVVLPGMSGRELSERFLNSSPRTAILLMSGYAEQIVFAEQSAQPMEYLAKPFSIPTLLARIRKMLNDRRMGSKVA